MNKKVVYVIPRQENSNLYDFTANRFLFQSLKSFGSDGHFDMNVTETIVFEDESIYCSPISLGG